MHATRLAVICTGTLTLAGAAWVLWNPSTTTRGPSSTASSTTPPPAQPLAKLSVAASRAAPSSSTTTLLANAPSIRATFEESRDCYYATNQVYAAKSVINACLSLPKIPETENQRAGCATTIETNLATIRALGDAVETCPSDSATARSFYAATKSAAAQGDVDAQACYVQALFQSDGMGLTYSQKEIDDYRRDAPRYIADGLSRGDWRIVALLARGGHDDGYSLLPLVTRDDIYTQYVMNRLLELGAQGAYANQLAMSIQASYLTARMTQPPPLTQEQIARGRKDALDLFHSSFDRQPLLEGPPTICAHG